MEILQFVNSKDIRNHLKEINYKFNTLEAAWLIHQSQNHTLLEKLEAFKELMKEYPDCEVKERVNTVAQNSLFEYLTEYIAKYNELLSEFSKPNLIFSIDVIWDDDCTENKSYTVNQLFNSLESAIEQCTFEGNVEGTTFYINIVPLISNPTDGFFHQTKLRLRSSDLEIMDAMQGSECFDKYSMLDDVFDGLWFDFPTPFKVGDIVWNIRHPKKPVVLHTIGFEDMGERFFKSREFNGDSSDMTYGVYYPEDDGSLFSDVHWNYMDLEYYTDELEKEQKVLKPISYLLKKEIDVGLCVNATMALIKQLEADKAIPIEYTFEILNELGVVD